MERKLAYLGHGKLFYRSEGKSEQIDSPYGQDVIKRALERQAKNEWKTGGSSQAALYSRRSLWGTDRDGPDAVNVKVTAVAPSDSSDELMYVVSTESVGGLFKYNLKTQKETRIFHKERLFISDFAKHADGELLACCQRFPNGIASIALVRGNYVDEATEGDSVDESPSWVPGPGKQLVYQCAGVARNGNGIMVGLGPAHIQKLDLEKGEVSTLVENEKFDYLCPKMNKKGDLFYIRRPYEPLFSKGFSPGKAILDTILFPFRLARAFFDFLNVFSMTFSKKPLTTASGPKVEGPDEKSLFLRGRLIDAQQLQKEQEGKEESPALVPKSWELICRDAAGNEKVIASAVLSYDMDTDNSLVYTNGTAVFEIGSDGSNKKLLFKDKLVDSILLLD